MYAPIDYQFLNMECTQNRLQMQLFEWLFTHRSAKDRGLRVHPEFFSGVALG